MEFLILLGVRKIMYNWTAMLNYMHWDDVNIGVGGLDSDITSVLNYMCTYSPVYLCLYLNKQSTCILA